MLQDRAHDEFLSRAIDTLEFITRTYTDWTRAPEQLQEL